MADTTKSGVYQLENGMWGFRYTVTYNGKRKDVKRQKDELGRILKTEKAALRARESAMLHDRMNRIKKPVEKRMTFAEVYQEYCEMGRSGKAYGTRLAELNTPTHILCNQMGHASGKVTERYYLAVSKSGIDILVRNLNAIPKKSYTSSFL